MSTHIIAIDALDMKDRCEAASVSLVLNEPGYEPEVLLPDRQWTSLTAEQVASLRPPTGTADSALLEIIRLPVDPAELERIYATSTEFKLADENQPVTFDPFAGQHASTFIGHVDNAAGQRTTTTDRRVGRLNGIHLDNFDKLPISKRRGSRRRLAVNLGPGHRFLIAATEDIRDINARYEIPGAYPRTEDVREFVRQGGRLGCVRIRLEPGEGYIAPTELVPHDGSTSGAALPSRIAFWLGHWPAGVLPAAIA